MLEGADIPQSPAWWFKTLAHQLQDRRNGRRQGRLWTRGQVDRRGLRPGLDLLSDYLEGDPPLLKVAKGWEEQFREVVRLGKLNPAPLIVQAKSNRLKLLGFRTSAVSDDIGDSAARDIMRANDMVVKTREIHEFAMTYADGYSMVTPPAGRRKFSLITAEDPRETITADDAATGETLAALKLYRDDYDSADIAHLYVLEDNGDVSHYEAHAPGRTHITATSFRLSERWMWVGDNEDSTTPVVRDALPRMPIIRYKNRLGRGEFETHLTHLDRINDQIMNKVVIGKIQAFRQMAIKGLPDKRFEMVDGKRVEVDIDYTGVFQAAPGSLWQLPAEAELWQSQSTDVGPIRQAIKDDLEQLAAMTQTSLPSITPDAASGSAEGAALMRESEVGAASTIRDYFTGPHVRTMSVAFEFQGEKERADVTKLEALWGPIERYSLAERGAAAAQAATSLPVEAIRRDIWQYEPGALAELRQMDGRDLLFRPPAGQSGQDQPAAVKFQQPGQPPAEPGATGGPGDAG